MFCPKCGTSVPDGSKFCEGCGNNMQLADQENGGQQEAPASAEPSNPSVPPVYQSPPSSYQPQQSYQPQPSYQPVPAYPNQGTGYTDEREKVYGVGGWLGTMLLLCIPLVNIVMMFVWIFSSKVNKNKKNFAIATLIMAVIGIILSIALSATLINALNSILGELGDMDFMY